MSYFISKYYMLYKLSNPYTQSTEKCLVEERLLLVVGVPLLCHPVAGSSDLDKLLDVDPGLLGRRLDGSLLGLLGGPPRQVGLMLLTLGVRQVAGLHSIRS